MENKTGYIDAVADAEAWRMVAFKAITIPGIDHRGLTGLYVAALGRVNSSPWLAALRSNPEVSNDDIQATRDSLQNEYL